MREMEDARSLAGLAMEVYSDRISVDPEEQERLRFSPDDIVRLPVHRALNVWVADGVPRPGFVAATLPMEGMRSEELAAFHADAQRERGGHYPKELPDPLVQLPVRAAGTGGPATPKPKRPNRASASRSQLSFVDVTEMKDGDEH
jgi:hypothetical protein